MKVDVDPFKAFANYTKPDFNICMVKPELVEEENDLDTVIGQFKVEASNKIYPQIRESLVKFLQKKCNANPKVMMCS